MNNIVDSMNTLLIATPTTINASWYIITILVLLLISGILSGAETACFALTSKEVDYLKTRNRTGSLQLVALLEQPKILAATILIASVFINLAIIVITNFLLHHLLSSQLNFMLTWLIQTVLVAIVLLLFGMILPKVYARQKHIQMALFAAPVLSFVTVVFSPISRLIVSSNTYFDLRPEQQLTNDNSVNENFEQEIETALGQIATTEDVNIFKGILKFSNITVRQIMRTRLDICGVPYDYTIDQLKQYAIKNGYSRMPVYKGSLDTIIGIVNSKDLLLFEETATIDWHRLVRPAYFIPGNKFIEELFKELQAQHLHFAVVVDEFGGTAGIVTIEDIIEQIMGEIKDEFDVDELDYKMIDENNFVFEGKALINEVCSVIKKSPKVFDAVKGESDSIAGLILEICGRFPKVNEKIVYNAFEFTILEIDKMRIKRVKLTLLPTTS